MKVGDLVAVSLNRPSKVVRHGTIRVHVQQNSPCVTDQAKGPNGDHAGPDDTCEGVHPEPSEHAGEQQTHNHQDRYGGIGDHMNHCGPHVVVALCSPMRMLVFLKDDRMLVASNAHTRYE